MRKRIYSLISLLAAAFLIIVILVITAPSPNRQKNGFNRQYLQESPLTHYMAIPTHDWILDIAGVDGSTFYFSTINPSLLLSSVMEPGAGTDTFRIPLRQSLKDSMETYFFTEVDNQHIFVYAYNIPAINKISITMPSDEAYAPLSAGGFSQAHALRDGRHFMLRKLDLKEKDQFFILVTLNGDSVLTGTGLTALRRDGGISTDGSLNYDRSSGLFTYLYYYSNKYVTFDSTMRLISEGTTIDTFSISRFSISSTMAQKNVYTNQGPDQMVNGFSCADNGVMFVQAKLKADNDQALFADRSVIDLYDLRTNTYKGSYDLGLPARSKVNQLFVEGNKLLVHCADSVYAFRITY